MISVDNTGEFTFTILDVIKQLNGLKKFVIQFWINGNDLPFSFDETCDFHFIQESVKITKYVELNYSSSERRISYIALDSIVAVSVIEYVEDEKDES